MHSNRLITIHCHCYISRYISDNSFQSGQSRTETNVLTSSLTSTMPRLPELALTISIPTHHQGLLCRVREAKNSIKSLDPVKRILTTLYWYVRSALLYRD
jgi:hypothetical protein